MANKNALNKNSLYVSSLVDFILDTKPYHTKLTEIVEEYRFNDQVNVSIKERFSSKMKIDSTWMYNYFSSANPLYRTMPAQRLVSPSFTADTFVVGRDENLDLALVPYAYSKKAFDGVGVNAAYVRRADSVEPLTESVDYFQSHGSFQFQIKQTLNASNELDPLWSTTTDDELITEARRSTRANALDRENPSSAINRVEYLLGEIQLAVDAAGGHGDVQRELDALYAILAADDLPRSYEAMLAWLAIPNDNDVLVALEAPNDREFFEQQFSRYSSPLFFGMFTDLGVRESGRAEYPATSKSGHLVVSNFAVVPGKEIEEWKLEAAGTSTTYRITGSSAGFVGLVAGGDSFDNGRISFTTSLLSAPTAGDALEISPTRKLVIGADAPLETWNIIKVNPIAHDRPTFSSARFGTVSNLAGKPGEVSILDQTMPAGEIVLTARDGRFFDLTSTTDPAYTAAVQVGAPYNDGKLAFTINKGTTDFAKGDRFYLLIENLPAYADGLELAYGYDMDPYDDDTITNYPAGGKVGFYYDGRFADYDLASMNLRVSENAIDGRKWHLRAIPDYARPIANVPGLPGQSTNNLPIYYAANFRLEYSDDDFRTKTNVTDIAIGGSYASVAHGISLTLAGASRPFVAVAAYDEHTPGNRVEGGDIFSFEVKNPRPRLVESPVGLTSSRVPRLIMHSDSFFDAPRAAWTVSFDTPGSYTIVGTDGMNEYGPVTADVNAPGVITNEGLSFRGVHFTIVPRGEFVAGEKFTFNTFDAKPSYLVHGSVSGFTAPAQVGKYYWNGKIGFKIRPPRSATYAADIDGMMQAKSIAAGKYVLREDCPSLIYTFKKTSADGYRVSRSDIGIAGFGSTTVPYKDQYLYIELSGVAEQEFQLVVDSHDYPLWNAADVVILSPRARARLPLPGEAVVIEKTEDAKFSLNLVPNRDVPADIISALSPITIDQRFIDTNTRGIPLGLSSPETSLLQGWIPLTATRLDSSTSIAEFSDPVTQYIFRSAANNRKVGTLKQQDSASENEPIVFEWDEAFFQEYLPLNAEANLVIHGTGWNDRVHARVTESVKFLLGGGALAEDWLFRDSVNVAIQDDSGFNVVSNYNDNFAATVRDGPFGGFMAGYDNLPWDGFVNILGPAEGHKHLKTDDLTPYTLVDGAWIAGVPVQAIVDTLPTTYAVGELFYSQGDSKLYTRTIAGWDAGAPVPQSATPTGTMYFDTTSNQLLSQSSVPDSDVLMYNSTTGILPYPAPYQYFATDFQGPYWAFGEVPSEVHGCEPMPDGWITNNYRFEPSLPCSWVSVGHLRFQTLPTIEIWTAMASSFGPALPTILTRVYNEGDMTVYDLAASWEAAEVMNTHGPAFPVETLGEDLNPLASLYDVGQPPDLYSLLSNTGLDDAGRAAVLKQWGFYLSDGQAPSTEAQWAHLRTMLAIDPVPGLMTGEIGYPAIGMGMDIMERPEGDVGTSISEAMITFAVDRANLLDARVYGAGLLDGAADTISIMYPGSLPPVPGTIPPGSTYDSFETPLTVDRASRVFEVYFTAPVAALNAMAPVFSIWVPGAPAPVQVAVVERVRPGVFRFSVAQPTQAKIIVG